MTFPASGTTNAVQAALGISQAQITAAGPAPVSVTNYPTAWQHGGLRQNWADAGLLNVAGTIWTQTNTVYRM